jgi:hypothetical protein
VRATLCAAVMDGLLLEVLSTGDQGRTTAALALFERLISDKTRLVDKRADRKTGKGRQAGPLAGKASQKQGEDHG